MSSEQPTQPRGDTPARDVPDWVRIVRRKVESIAYGVVQIVVHDGRVTQIEVTEKTRLDERTTRHAIP